MVEDHLIIAEALLSDMYETLESNRAPFKSDDQDNPGK